GEDDRATVELDRVALAVAEADGLDAREIRERPREAGGRILAAGEEHQSLFAHGSVVIAGCDGVHGSFPVFVPDCKTCISRYNRQEFPQPAGPMPDTTSQPVSAAVRSDAEWH